MTPTQSGIERIAAAFAGSGKRAALMPYLMGGFPDIERSLAIGEACVQAGADMLELGVPFSDPLADGPVIHAAATSALAGGVRVEDVLGLAASLARRVPVIVMAYANTVLRPGAEQFIEALAQAGVNGLIVPDLPFEEGEEIARASELAGIALVPLIAPTTTEERLQEIGRRARRRSRPSWRLSGSCAAGSSPGRPASGAPARGHSRRCWRAPKRAPQCRWRSGSGSRRRRRRRTQPMPEPTA